MNLQTFYIAQNGYKGALLLGVLLILSFICDVNFLTFILFLLFVFWIFIFRNPERLATHLSSNAFLSPIDGEIAEIQTEGNKTKIVIKVGLFDVGVLRSPFNISPVHFTCIFGTPLFFFKKRDFFAPKVTLSFGNHLMILQQNLFHFFPLKEAKEYERGERIGFLKAGQVILEIQEIELKVNVGDKIKGGESVIGYLQ